MQSGLAGSTSDRIQYALGNQGLGQQGGILGQILGSLGGTPSGTAGGLGELLGGGSSGGMGDMLGSLASMGGGMLGDAKRSVEGGNPLAVGGLAGLAGALLGGRSGGARGALGGGALALLAGLAYNAIRKERAAAAAAASLTKELPLGLRPAETPEEEEELQARADLILRAMISAAKADGAIDSEEIARIVGRIDEDGADPEARRFVLDEMRKPLDLDGLARAVPDRETGVQVYAASLLAIEADTPSEREYLDLLARRLRLGEREVQEVRRSLNVS